MLMDPKCPGCGNHVDPAGAQGVRVDPEGNRWHPSCRVAAQPKPLRAERARAGRRRPTQPSADGA